METTKLKSLRNRILKASKSLNIMGDMLLIYEFDAMPTDHLKQLKTYIETHKNPCTYEQLNKALEQRA
jgi:hypothetical protein